MLYKREELFTLGGQMGCMNDMAVVLQERGTVYPWRAHGLISCFYEERVARRFSFLCCVFIAFFAFIPCLVYQMLQVSLDYPFLMAPSVFSNVFAFH